MTPSAFTPVGELDARFHRLAVEYDVRKAEAEQQVVSWEWASNSRYDPRPLYYERHRFPRGRLLRNRGEFQYGRDEAGRVLVEREFTEFAGQVKEGSYRWLSGTAEAAHYDHYPGKPPIAYWHLHFTDERLTVFESRATQGIFRELYFWNGARVERIEVQHSSVSHRAPVREPEPIQIVEADYDDLGVLTAVRVIHRAQPPAQPNDVVEVAYSRPPREWKFKDLLQLVTTGLIEHIPPVLRRYGLDEPAYCVALWWSPGQFSSFPPAIGVGLESERAAWAAAGPAQVRERAWSPAEFRRFAEPALELNDPDLIRICELLNQEVNRREDDAALRRVLQRVTRTLNERRWADVMPVTADFVVYAVAQDDNLPELRRSIKASAPVAYKALTEKAWL
jgi:hypothetical protein